MKKRAEKIAKNGDIIWDIVIIGGGPAGMMAAGRAAEKACTEKREVKILLLEKNDSLGKKLLITGGGRCNVTNAEPDMRILLSKFKNSDQFLFSAFAQHGVDESLEFFHSRNMPTKEEALKRVFPASNTAQSVWDVLVAYLKKGGVTIMSNTEVVGFTKIENTTSDSKIQSVILKNKKEGTNEIYGKSFIVATGGTSRPETGSTGDGFKWLRELGHNVSEPSTALVPISLKESVRGGWASKLAGLTLGEVKITLLQNDVKQNVKKGKILFTHVGLSGPTILNMSRDIGELLKYGDVTISLDIAPAYDFSTLNTALQELFKKEHRKQIKNSFGESFDDLIPNRLVPVILERSGISPETACNSVTREQRIKLMQTIKDLCMNVRGLLGVDKAVVTSGGVSLSEIDFKTMQSRLIPNLYVIGDMLDIDRPSGGYSLQLCWTTGWVAGTHVSSNII